MRDISIPHIAIRYRCYLKSSLLWLNLYVSHCIIFLAHIWHIIQYEHSTSNAKAQKYMQPFMEYKKAVHAFDEAFDKSIDGLGTTHPPGVGCTGTATGLITLTGLTRLRVVE